MAGKVKAIPDGYHTVTPYLIVKGAAQAIEFYKKAFGATEVMRIPAPGGMIGHADLLIGDSHVMLSDEWPDMKIMAPKAGERPAVSIALYVEDVDATVDRAVRAGATLARPVEDQFYGDRMGQIEDPFGHTWAIGQHVEDVSQQEMARRSKELYGA